MSGYHHEHPTPEPIGPPPNIPEAPTVASLKERLAVVEANFGQMWLAAVYAVHCAESLRRAWRMTTIAEFSTNGQGDRR